MPKTILVVEDYDDTRELMRFMLEIKGYLVDEADNGWAAVEYVKEKCPDLILMDVSMPDVDGITATALIKQDEERCHIPVVFVTAHADRYRDKALEAGGSEIITKPVDSTILYSVVSKYLN
ncbi:MAG: response regulator [Acidobacteriota bacterium]|nr:response regulator [Acidobacteriota bacterium]